MVEFDVIVAYTLACTVIILAPGPDNILALSRGLSQGRIAALVSSIGAGAGLLVHTVLAALGLAVLLQTSATAFLLLKITGAIYLIYLGVKAIRSRDLISFAPSARQSYCKILMSGFLTNVLNPKPAMFILVFVPQFISLEAGNVLVQTLSFGALYSLMTVVIFSTLGCFASVLALFLKQRPRAVFSLNIGAGITFIAAGLSVAALEKQQ